MTALARAARPDWTVRAASNRYYVASGVTVYPGAVVGMDTAGFIFPWDGASAVDWLIGLAMDSTVLSSELAGDGTVSEDNAMRVWTAGLVLRDVPVAGVSAAAQHHDVLYSATDNWGDDLTLTPTTADSIGRVLRYLGTGTQCDVLIFSAEEFLAQA